MKKQITVTVNVTAADIKKGCAASEENCPINLATTRAVKKIFGRSKLDLLLLSTLIVSTTGVPEVQNSNLIVDTFTSEDSEDRIENFIDAFDSIERKREKLSFLKNDLSLKKGKAQRREILQEIYEEELLVKEYEEHTKPFSFDLTLDFS